MEVLYQLNYGLKLKLKLGVGAKIHVRGLVAQCWDTEGLRSRPGFIERERGLSEQRMQYNCNPTTCLVVW